jgi:pimeloyl-ACP methyl ester carboxylesterase
MRNSDRSNSASRFVSQEKFKLWPQATLHTQWPGNGAPDDPATLQLAMGQLPAIEDFNQQQPLNRDALIALLEKILAIEPNGPPFYQVEFIGAPDWFKQGPLALPYGVSILPLTYAPAVNASSDLRMVQQDKADGPDLVRCWLQQDPPRQLPNLKMPILVLSSEASYHAPYDHCTVKYLEQAGVKPTFIRLADRGIHGNSHVLMLEKNNKDSAAVIEQWLDHALPARE